MANDFGPDDKAFQRWQALRGNLKTAKAAKDWNDVVETCSEILQLDQRSKHIGIFVPLIFKELGNAWLQLGDLRQALADFQKAKDGLIQYRNTSALNRSDDWLDEIARLEKKIERVKAKQV